jgi:cytochrome c oxidase subunit 3
MWITIGSLCMMFAGLTSAYIVKRNQTRWLDFDLPVVFWYSTVVIILSSFTIYLALLSFKAREIVRYRTFIAVTVLLGFLFAVLQSIGFASLNGQGIQLLGAGSNAAASFLFVIIVLHILHVAGGVIALLIVFLRSYSFKIKNYNSVPLEIVSTYWHFVDILWIYLFLFFMWIR